MSTTKISPIAERQIQSALISQKIIEKRVVKNPDPIQYLIRSDKKEIGLVELDNIFFIKRNFTLVKDGGMFLELPKILFDEAYFDQAITDSNACQLGEYDSIGNVSDYQMNCFSVGNGFGVNLDLRQVYALCFGAKHGPYKMTLNQQSIPYLIPLKSKKGDMVFTIMCYKEGFLPFVDYPSGKKWYRAKFIARYQKLHDPLEFLRNSK